MSVNSQAYLIGCLDFDESNLILGANATIENWLSYNSDELEGKSLDIILDRGTKFYLQSQVLPSLKLRGHLEELYLPLRSKHGETVPALINLARLESDNRTVTKAAIVRIQARAKLEQELLVAKKLAEAANKTRTKFLAMMSHELRTPLHAIRFSTQLMLEEAVGALTDDQKELLETANEASLNLSRLIEDILGYAKLENGKVSINSTQIYVEDALRRAEKLAMPMISESGLHYVRATVSPDLTVHADPDRLQQILLNLLTNATKFTPNGGRITIDIESAKNSVSINVTDNGPGIDDFDLHNIFEPFIQLKKINKESSSSGVGLGLSICRHLAEAMNGQLQVISELGKGSTFTIRLPRSAELGLDQVDAPLEAS